MSPSPSNPTVEPRPNASVYHSPLGGTPFYAPPTSPFDGTSADVAPHLGGRPSARLAFSPQDPFGYGFALPSPPPPRSAFAEPALYPDAAHSIPYEAIPIRDRNVATTTRRDALSAQTATPVRAATLPAQPKVSSSANHASTRRWILWGALGIAAAGVVYLCLSRRYKASSRRRGASSKAGANGLHSGPNRCDEEGKDGGEDPHGDVSAGSSVEEDWEMVSPSGKSKHRHVERAPATSSDTTTFHFPEPTETAFATGAEDYDDLSEDLSSLGGASAGASLTSVQEAQ